MLGNIERRRKDEWVVAQEKKVANVFNKFPCYLIIRRSTAGNGASLMTSTEAVLTPWVA